MPYYQVINVSLFKLLLFLGPILLIFLFFKWPKSSGDKSLPVREKKDWSVPCIDKYADGNSLFHSWDPRFKIFTLTLYSFLVVSVQTLLVSLLAFGVSVAALIVSGLPWDRSLGRLKAMSGFLFMFLVILPFTVKGKPAETLIVINGFEGLPFHSSGFWLASSIVCKAAAVALLMEPLFSTSKFSVTLIAVSRLGVPVSVCQMVMLSHRYIHVFLQEMKRMYRAMKVRGFKRRTNLDTMRVLGNFLGMLVVRSFDRTQRVYDAMLSRGYSGIFPSYVEFKTVRSDWHISIFWLLLGGFLVFLDLIC